MIYGFAKQSGGAAKIYSEVGVGTCVKIYLPRYRGHMVEDAEPIRQESALPTQNAELVLVVEDDAIVRKLVVDLLQDLGYRTLEAVDGPAALELLSRTEHLDLLITDIGLPGLNGRQVAEAARASHPGLKTMFMTGYAENASIANGVLEPGMHMITKPFAMDEFGRRVRHIIQGESANPSPQFEPHSDQPLTT
jgi:CheY-like chemotaxis protein